MDFGGGGSGRRVTNETHKGSVVSAAICCLFSTCSVGGRMAQQTAEAAQSGLTA
jgi:hypothetical protein